MNPAARSRARSPLPSRLLHVADPLHAAGSLATLVGRSVAAGVRFVELRHQATGRRPPTAELLSEARAALAVSGQATVLVNDRVDVALLAGAHGVHLGQDDLGAVPVREIAGPDLLLGLSTHAEDELARAQDLPLDYVAIGPVFASRTKAGHAEPVGLGRLERWCSRSRLPVVAIGGITASSARAVLQAGAAAVAVGHALSVGDVAQNVRRFSEALGS